MHEIVPNTTTSLHTVSAIVTMESDDLEFLLFNKESL